MTFVLYLTAFLVAYAGVENYFQKDGSIDKAFWSLDNLNISEKKRLVPIVDDDLMFIVNSTSTDGITKNEFNKAHGPEDRYWVKRENTIKKLQKKGFHLSIDKDGDDGKALKIYNKWSVFKLVSTDPINKRFYFCRSGKDAYLIDSVGRVKAYLLISGIGEGRKLKLYGFEQIDKNVYRFVFGDFRDHGRNPFLEVHDVDLLNNTDQCVECSYVEDLDNNGHLEIVRSWEVKNEIDWYWIYSYRGGKWQNVSNEYPNYYKGKVRDDLAGVEDYWETMQSKYRKGLLKIGLEDEKTFLKQFEYQYILKALLHAAEVGGPSAFVK
jgi:hypothetical protein